MQELILKPDEAIILAPGELIGAGDVPLRIRFGYANADPNTSANQFGKMERLLWENSKQQTGYQTAVYRRGDESRLIRVVPENPKPEDIDMENHSGNITIRAFKVEKADMLGWLPKHDDTLEWNKKIYTIRRFGPGVFYRDVGNYNVVLRIYVTEYRTHGTT